MEKKVITGFTIPQAITKLELLRGFVPMPCQFVLNQL